MERRHCQSLSIKRNALLAYHTRGTRALLPLKGKCATMTDQCNLNNAIRAAAWPQPCVTPQRIAYRVLRNCCFTERFSPDRVERVYEYGYFTGKHLFSQP